MVLSGDVRTPADITLGRVAMATRLYSSSGCEPPEERELDEHGSLPGMIREYRRSITAGKWGEERKIQLA